MLLPALSLAIIGLIQGAGVSQGTPNPDGKFPNVSRDFFGQGAANLATSFVSGLPAGGSISGTALIQGAGARSRLDEYFRWSVRGIDRAAVRALGQTGGDAIAGSAAHCRWFPGIAH